MKTLRKIKILFAIGLLTTAMACGTQQKFKGSASDRTGTNGATNGTGKVYSGA